CKMYLGHVKVLLGMFLSLKTLYRKRTVIWPFYFYTIIRTLSNYAAKLDAENAIFERLDPHKLASCINVANIDTPIKIILLNIDPAQITTILDELNKYHQELEMIHHSNEYNIDITAQNINKYTALQYIFDADVKYIAFGNDHNDIVMLQHASSGYIIGPSEAYTHAILKLDKIKHIDNNTQAICKVLKSYK
ncbi:HAD hydrolase family protein, partial [Staphylococcus aureus]